MEDIIKDIYDKRIVIYLRNWLYSHIHILKKEIENIVLFKIQIAVI